MRRLLLSLSPALLNNQVLKPKPHTSALPSISHVVCSLQNKQKEMLPKLSDPQILDRLQSKMLAYSLSFYTVTR